MWCLISQPNSLVFEVKVDPKSIGQECLEKVCEYLGISKESDYFGLKYESSRGEELWLNLRNPIDRQVNCHGHTSPLRLALRVKFWVPPHLLLQESTRHQFYLNGRSDLIEKRLLANDWDGVSRIIGLIAQAETDDYDSMRIPHNLYMQASTITCLENTPRPNDLLQRVIASHKKMKNMKKATAEYWLLKEISELENFGEEIFNGSSCGMALGVGPHGITIYENNKDKKVISFTSIISASSHKRTFKLEYLSDDNKPTLLEVKLESSPMASGLYRAITEKHAFYSCETVRSAVTAQFIRDLKGTIVSIFNEDSSLGKKYVFDIRRTCREVYDNARRAIFQENQERLALDLEKSACENECDGENCKDSEERLTRFIEAMTCKICMDTKIDSVLIPCSHLVACTVCAARIDRCPLCRAEITQVQKVFMPVW